MQNHKRSKTQARVDLTTKSKVKFLLFLALLFLSSCLLNISICSILGLGQISQVDLVIFSILTALLATFVILITQYLREKRYEFTIRFRRFFVAGILLALFVFLLLLGLKSESNMIIAFQSWGTLSPITLTLWTALFLGLLYTPAIILGQTVLKGNSLSFLERLVFYPALSSLILAPLSVVDSYFRIGLLSSQSVLLVLALGLGGLTVHCIRQHKQSFTETAVLTTNLVEISGVAIALIFNLFIAFSALGESSAFLRGDMWGTAQTGAFVNRYGLAAYSSSPVQVYPPFFDVFWSALSKLSLIPGVNGLIIVAFFNHAFSILAFYVMAKTLLKNWKLALLSLVVWTSLSGFSWLYLVFNHPPGSLSGTDLSRFLNSISNCFGIQSGSKVSPIYADDHSLTRLWSLGLLFASLAALVKGYFNDTEKVYALVFFAGVIQILLGHVVEVPLIAIAVIALLLMGKDFSSRYLKRILLASVIVSIIGLTIGAASDDVVLSLVSLLPLLAITLGLITVRLRKVFRTARTRALHMLAPSKKVAKIVVPSLLLYVYGLMYLAFLISSHALGYPIATVWYGLAIEWGFLGLMAILTIVWFSARRERSDFGFEYAGIVLILQLLLLLALNVVNYYYFYVQTPYPFQPVLFLPFLALIASSFFASIGEKSGHSRRILRFSVIVLILLVFSFGCLDHILSASYWKNNNGWWSDRPLYPAQSEYELMNFLYSRQPKSTYEFVGTFSDFYDPSTYVIYPSGLVALSQPLIDILSYTNDSREIYLLTRSFPIQYFLLSENHLPESSRVLDSYLYSCLNSTEPIFSNSNYKLFATDQLNLSSTDLLPKSNSFLTAGKMAFSGNLSVEGSNDVIDLERASGEIYPMNDGKIGIRTEQKTDLHLANHTLNFDGIDDYVDVPNSVSLNPEEITIEAWIKMSSVQNNNYEYIVRKTANGKPFDSAQRTLYGLSIGYSNRKVQGYLWTEDSPICQTVESKQELDLNKWNYVAFTYSYFTHTARIYLNGMLDKEDNSVTGKLRSNSEDLYISNKQDGILFFNGTIADARVYNRALSEREILYSYGNHVPMSTKGLILDLPMNEGQGMYVLDSSQNHNNGTILGDPTWAFNDNVVQVYKYQWFEDVTTPSIRVNGNLTLTEMKSTWGYFREIKCFSKELDVHGDVSFRVLNSFKNRIYLESFVYHGTYEASSLDVLNENQARTQIERYLGANNVNPLQVAVSLPGIFWAFVISAFAIGLWVFSERRGSSIRQAKN